ncbi:MAG: hypothetical protein LBL16_01345 [Endomicrobium sp.]|jgi:hypothetical protein|nr:hypothetical protein [Endomicrobium sp.]
MFLYDVKKVQVVSVLRVVSVVFAILGSLIGLFIFFLPTDDLAAVFGFGPTDDLAAVFGFGVKLLLWVMVVVFYTVIMVIEAIAVAWLYNFVATKLNCSLVISLEPKEK